MKKRRNIFKLLIPLIIILTGLILLLYNYNSYHLQEVDNKKAIDIFFQEENYQQEDIKTIENDVTTSTYIAVLEIPSVNLKRGIVNPNSIDNTVSKNIAILDSSEFPDTPNSLLILASHSGNSLVSFFKNLDKLLLEDDIYLYYSGVKYHYKLKTIEHQEKGKTILINRKIAKTILVLTTCDQTDKTKQLVLTSELVSISEY